MNKIISIPLAIIFSLISIITIPLFASSGGTNPLILELGVFGMIILLSYLINKNEQNENIKTFYYAIIIGTIILSIFLIIINISASTN